MGIYKKITTTEAQLKERIKELTCLYEVTSIIVNSDYDQLEASLEAIAYCLKKACQFEHDTEVIIRSGAYDIETKGYTSDMVSITSNIKVFYKLDGFIKVGYPQNKYEISDF